MTEETKSSPVYAIRPTEDSVNKLALLKERFPTLSRSKLLNIMIELTDPHDIENYILGKVEALAA